MEGPRLDPGHRCLLVTGASGFIGARLATRALERGLDVRTLTRREWQGPPHVPAAGRFLGELPHGLPAALMDGVDAVVHCAALTGRGGARRSHGVNVLGTIELARAARDAGVRRFVFLSSQQAAPDAPSDYGRTKHEAEQALLGLGGLDVVVLRAGLVVGGRAGLYGRMADVVRRLPVLPVLGDGSTLVQPIHVDDLCEAILRACEMSLPGAGPDAGRILRLGDPQGLRLDALLSQMSLALAGRRKPLLRIPLAPLEVVARVAEAARLPLPVTRANLAGARRVPRMDTSGDLEALGLRLRGLPEALRPDGPAAGGPAPLERRPVGVAVVGAGRIGLLHALTASRQRGLALAAVVDPNPRALGMLRGMGLRTRWGRSLREVAGSGASVIDAVIVATPPDTHLPLAREAASLGLHALVEKPLALRAEEAEDFRALDEAAFGSRLQVGYLAPRYPQAQRWLRELRTGEPVRGFLGLTLLSFVGGSQRGRWETSPERSGGGVLPNAAGHVVSLAVAAFGRPGAVRCESRRLDSAAVEDAAIVEMTYRGFGGRCLASWSMPPFARQENRLVAWTGSSTIVIANAVAAKVGHDGSWEVRHQVDHDVGVNVMPDYAGGGICAEHRDLQDVVRTACPPPVGVSFARDVEDVLAQALGGSSSARIEDGAAEASGPQVDAGDGVRGLVVDVRDLEGPDARQLAAASPTGSGEVAGWLARTAQLPDLAGRHGVSVTVPDFLGQARLLSSGRHAQLLRTMGWRGAVAAAAGAAGGTLRERGPTFWAAAEAFLAAERGLIPRDFRGSLLLHPHLVDFALALDRDDWLERALDGLRARAPRAAVGVHSGSLQAALRLSLLERPPEIVHFLSSPRGWRLDEAVVAARAALPGVRLVADVGPAPRLVHRLACAHRDEWLHGADALSVDAVADDRGAGLRRRQLAPHWERSFPGRPLPEAAL